MSPALHCKPWKTETNAVSVLGHSLKTHIDNNVTLRLRTAFIAAILLAENGHTNLHSKNEERRNLVPPFSPCYATSRKSPGFLVSQQ